MSRIDPQSISDILRTVFVVSREAPDGTHTCFLLSASPAFQESACLEIPLLRPGVLRYKWSPSQAKQCILQLRHLGYYALLYKHQEIEGWYKEFDSLPAYSSEHAAHPLVDIAKTLPPCHTYVELFGSGAPMFAARPPTNVEVYNDIYSHVVSMFRVLRKPSTLGWFFLLSRLFPPAEPIDSVALRQFLRYKDEDDLVLLAYAWYMQARSVLTVAEKEYGSVPELFDDEARSSIADVVSAIDPNFLSFRDRLMRMQFEYNDWRRVLSTYDTDKTLFWVDVPTQGQHALDDGQVELLVDSLTSSAGAAAVYISQPDRHPLIDALLAEQVGRKRSRWKRLDFDNCWIYRKV